MDIVDILKDLMSPRSAAAGTMTKTPTSCGNGGGGGGGLGTMGSSSKGKGIAKLGVRIPDSFDEEDSTIVHLLPAETEETEEYYDDDDDNDDDENIMENDESTMIQLVHLHSQIIPSMLSCSEDDTEDEVEVEDVEDEEDSTIVQPLPGEDDATLAPTFQQQQLREQQTQSITRSCNGSHRSMPIQEVFTKKKKRKKEKDNNSSIKKGGEGGVEIVDVIREHFDFSPRWDDAANMDSAVAAAGNSAADNKNAVLDDESTVIQLLPGEMYDFGDNDDDNSDIVFADKRMRLSKNAENARQSSSSVKKKAATAAAVFVTLTVCLGVGYKAGNIMTSKSSSSSSSSSVTMTALTPEDCLALQSVTKEHENDGAGSKPTKQRRQQLMRQGKLRRKLVESDWKRVS
jgi:hypothetical protein